MASYQSIVEELLLATGASRALLQLAGHDGRFDPVAEAVTHCARQIRNDASDAVLFSGPAFERLRRDRQIIAQDNLAHADPAVAPVLIEHYGARA